MTISGARALLLPRVDGSLARYALAKPVEYERPSSPLRCRVFFAAAHVVGDPLGEPDGSGRARLDWDATLAFRHHLWSYGLGVAEAMDTSQRGMGLDWPTTRELIRRSTQEARAVGGRIAVGVGTDQLPPGAHALDRIVAAYLEQCELVEDSGAQVVLMASRALAAAARSPEDYRQVYDAVLDGARHPVILHWLGEQFDPQLAGYWGAPTGESAIPLVDELIHAHAERIDGIKVSLLDADLEVEIRGRLPHGVRLYTGDDYHYPALILGDGDRHSDALLGIFDAIAPAASAALQALDSGEPEQFQRTLESTVPLARHIFSAPTFYYKTGLVFLAYLNGHQRHFRMVGGLESARSLVHLSETFRLADRAGLLVDPELAVDRMHKLLALAGVRFE